MDTIRSAQATQVVDAGLRNYMLSVYNWMSIGLLTVAVTAFGISHTSLVNLFYTLTPSETGVHRSPTILAWIVAFAPLAVVWMMGSNVGSYSKTKMQGMYLLLAALLGAGLTSIFIVYTSVSIVSTFFVTAAMFASMSIWGYTTGRDLTSVGNFMFMGLIGLIIAMVVNIFIASPALAFAISVVGVLVFVVLTACDTQRIKNDYLQFSSGMNADQASSMAVYSSLSLLLHFINLFMFMLQFLGVKKND